MGKMCIFACRRGGELYLYIYIYICSLIYGVLIVRGKGVFSIREKGLLFPIRREIEKGPVLL